MGNIEMIIQKPEYSAEDILLMQEYVKQHGSIKNRDGDVCKVVNKYGPNIFGVERPEQINSFYLGTRG